MAPREEETPPPVPPEDATAGDEDVETDVRTLGSPTLSTASTAPPQADAALEGAKPQVAGKGAAQPATHADGAPSVVPPHGGVLGRAAEQATADKADAGKAGKVGKEAKEAKLGKADTADAGKAGKKTGREAASAAGVAPGKPAGTAPVQLTNPRFPRTYRTQSRPIPDTKPFQISLLPHGRQGAGVGGGGGGGRSLTLSLSLSLPLSL